MDVEKIIASMTLEEKASLCSGANNWDTKAVARLGVPSITVSDGPHGLRRQDHYQDRSGKATTRTAVCFPAAASLASSFDRALLHEVGGLLGDECQAYDVQCLLGPAVNIKRSPLCGRNFEYFSEDPYAAGELAASYVAGIQEKGVSACVKHFAVNSQEYRRMSVSAEIDERTLHEIYFPAFEATVRKAHAKSFMCSYNRINGVYSSENPWLLTHILRDTWGFDGAVMTDWGANNVRSRGVAAGLNLEMPGSFGMNDREVVEAVKNGTLSMEALDRSVAQLLHWIDWCLKGKAPREVNWADHHAAARAAETRCAVLLKNEDQVLPLKKGQKILYAGGFAANPRYQGGGSSHIASFLVESALDCIPEGADVTYAELFRDGEKAPDYETALKLAAEADVVVLFAGLPASYESEGFDRSHMDLPQAQNEAIAAVAAVQPNTVVVLHNGSPVTMPWVRQVKGILELYMGGEAVGGATNDLLFGAVNPSGKLPETFPCRLEDTPAWPDYGVSRERAAYGEGVYVGYRYYDARKMQVLFPFGHGLSYTTFALSNLKVDEAAMTVSVDVTNTGSRFGAEVVQLYVGFDGEDHVGRPLRALKGFEKVALNPGETKTAVMPLDRRSFAYYDEDRKDWRVQEGRYTLYVGTSSRDLPLTASIHQKGERKPLVITEYTTLGEVLACCRSEDLWKKTASIIDSFRSEFSGFGDDEAHRKMFEKMTDGMPLHSLKSFHQVTDEEIDAVVQEVLAEYNA